jgi:formate hydrogenlyase subunit 4
VRLASILLHLLGLLLLPFLLPGVINRVKAWWGGRRGAPLLQPLWDTRRLLGKQPVYSVVTTAIFRLTPLVVLATTLVAAILAPLLPGGGLLPFNNDFVAFAYILGLGRMFLTLGALDTGSPFEGMGSAREATFSVFAEPALFLVFGTLALGSGHGTFAELMRPHGWQAFLTTPLCGLALFLLLQIECARLPVDDPTTHLELTMIHEVMILDHSGVDLAMLQYAAGLKLTIYAGLLAALVNPISVDAQPLLSALASLAGMLLIAVAIGFLESLLARLRMRLIPQFAMAVAVIAFLALVLATTQPELG